MPRSRPVERVRAHRGNPLVVSELAVGEVGGLGGAKEQVMFCGLWYDDDFVRTTDGWRMTRRVETKCFQKIL